MGEVMFYSDQTLKEHAANGAGIVSLHERAFFDGTIHPLPVENDDSIVMDMRKLNAH
jgi:hypothetical protein